MKRLAIFVHYDKDGLFDPYVEFYIRSLREVAEKIIFITTSILDEENLSKVRAHCDDLIVRENVGYDFMSYKVGLAACDLTLYDEVLICNDSVYGPLYPLGELMKRMSNEPCDYWGMSESFQYLHHLQSYFLVFKQRALRSDAFGEFWNKVGVIESKADLILEYEIGLSSVFQKIGLQQGVAFAIENEKKEARKKIVSFLLQGSYRKARNVYKRCHDGGDFACNTTLLFWDILIRNYRFPFLKSAVLRHNAFGDKAVKDYENIIKEAGGFYPCELIAQHQKRLQN
jgi:lipopolysaccharide biosynthesis protein